MKNAILQFVLITSVLVSFQSHADWLVITPQFIAKNRVLNGEVEAVNKAKVSAQTSGRVTKFNFDVDDYVSQGAVIAEFTNTEQKAQLKQANANADAALIAYKQAEIDYTRTKEVYSKKLVAKSVLDKALSNRDSLKARSIAATASVINATQQLDYTIIRAPYDGIVTNRYVEQGELVSPGTPIMEGLSLTKLRVVTNIPETIINLVKKNPVAEVRVNDQVFTASKITIFPYADKMTRTFKARIEFDSKQTPLFPGMTVKVSFKIGQRSVLLVPLSAVMKRSELSLIYVKHQEGKLLRHVKLGSHLGDNVEIISGLNANERVLVNPLVAREN